jgi:hypothetical protein
LDLLDLIFEENELNNDSNDIFFKRLSKYIHEKDGKITKHKLMLCKGQQCLQITREGDKVVLDLIEDDR